MKRRVVISGMGVISPLGSTPEIFWDNLVAGKNGIRHITRFEIDDRFASRIAGEVPDFDITKYISAKEARRMDPFTHFGLAASYEAIKHAALDLEIENRDRIGVIASSGVGGLATLEKEYFNLFKNGPRRISPFFIPMIIADILPGHISIKLGLKGPNYSTISACASSAHALGEAFRTIQHDNADIMLVGGAEASITAMGVGGFSSMRALSTRNDDPEHASRPFDAGRDGFIISEGSGILVLEELEHALARKAKIYAEMAGYGATADAHHITSPAPDGDGAVRAMQLAIKDAGLMVDDVDYINAHGTSTIPNDRTETLAIKTTFGERAYELPVSSTKSMIGHLLGASGAVELIATALSLHNQTIHPTRNQIEPDPQCDLNFVPNKAIKKDMTVAISNSFGFGGHNVCLVVKRYQ